MKSITFTWKVSFNADHREPIVQTLDDMTDALTAFANDFAKARGIVGVAGELTARFSDKLVKAKVRK